jgi:hypothetical protein
MNRTAILALSLLCLSAGMAFAEGDGSGPFGVPQSANSLPQSFLTGTAQYSGEQAIDQYLAAHGRGTIVDSDILVGSAPAIAAMQAHG